MVVVKRIQKASWSRMISGVPKIVKVSNPVLEASDGLGVDFLDAKGSEAFGSCGSI